MNKALIKYIFRESGKDTISYIMGSFVGLGLFYLFERILQPYDKNRPEVLIIFGLLQIFVNALIMQISRIAFPNTGGLMVMGQLGVQFIYFGLLFPQPNLAPQKTTLAPTQITNPTPQKPTPPPPQTKSPTRRYAYKNDTELPRPQKSK